MNLKNLKYRPQINTSSQYYKAICRAIPDAYTNKKSVLLSIRKNIENYLVEFPEASIEELQQEFGTPTEIAASFLTELPDTEITSYLYNKKKKHRIACVLCFLFIIAASLLLGRIWYIQKHMVVTIEDTVYIQYNEKPELE